MSKAKKAAAIVSVLVILLAAGYAVIYSYLNNPITYDGSDTDVLELYQNPENYDISNPDGVADIIVKENPDKTRAVNNVSAVVFDWRGFDTLGESFILLTAIAGSFVILGVHRKKTKTANARERGKGGSDEI